jgi:hypothetical protein
MMVMEDEGPPVQQNIPEASLPSNSNERQEPVPDWCRCGRCFITPQEIETSSVSTRSVLQTQEDLENYVLTQNFCYLAAEMLVISGMTHMIIAPGHLKSRHTDLIF